MKTNWMWDTRLTENRVKNILKNEKNPRFYIYAEKLFSRVTDTKTAFSYVPKQVFCQHWPSIKQRINKDAWNTGKADFWQKIYIQTAAQLDVPCSALPQRMNVAQQIKEARIKMGYTQAKMAKKLGVIQQFVSKVETGRANLSVGSLNRIADILGKKLIVRLE